MENSKEILILAGLSRQLQWQDCSRRHVPPGGMAVRFSRPIPSLSLAIQASRQCQ